MKTPRKNNISSTLNPFHVDYVQGSSYAINQPIIHSVWTELLELIKKIEEIKKIKIDLLTILNPVLTQSRYPLARTKENDALLPLSILQEALSNSQTDGESLYSFLKKCLQNKGKVNIGAQVKLALCRDIHEYLQENKQPTPLWFQSFIEQSNVIKKQALETTTDLDFSIRAIMNLNLSLRLFIIIYWGICILLGSLGSMTLLYAAQGALLNDIRIGPPHSLVLIAAILTPAAFLGIFGMLFSNQLISWWNKDKRLNELPSPSEESSTNIENLAESFMKMLNTKSPAWLNTENTGFFSRNRSQSTSPLLDNNNVSITIEEEPSTSSTSPFNI